MKTFNGTQMLIWLLLIQINNSVPSRRLRPPTRSFRTIALHSRSPGNDRNNSRKLSMLKSLKEKALSALGLDSPMEKTKTRYLMQLRAKEAEIRQVRDGNDLILEEAGKRVDLFDSELMNLEVQLSNRLLQLQLDALKVSEKLRNG